MVFLSSATEGIKKKHEEEFPNFPWSLAYRPTTDYKRLFDYDPVSSRAFEYKHTNEFQAYLKLIHVNNLEHIKSSSTPLIGGLITGGSFSWDYFTFGLIKKGLFHEEIFFDIECSIGANFDVPVEHSRLRISFKGLWYIRLLPLGYKLSNMPNLKSFGFE